MIRRSVMILVAILSAMLEKHLNSTVAIGTGEIIDSRSKPNEQRNLELTHFRGRVLV